MGWDGHHFTFGADDFHHGINLCDAVDMVDRFDQIIAEHRYRNLRPVTSLVYHRRNGDPQAVSDYMIEVDLVTSSHASEQDRRDEADAAEMAQRLRVIFESQRFRCLSDKASIWMNLGEFA